MNGAIFLSLSFFFLLFVCLCSGNVPFDTDTFLLAKEAEFLVLWWTLNRSDDVPPVTML